MRPPLLPSDEYEEIIYVRTLCADFIRNVQAFFDEKYPNGSPFVPSPEDYAVLDVAEGLFKGAITAGRDRYPEWTDEDIDGLAKTARIHCMMRFKRVERTIEKLPGWNLLVEGIIEAGKEPPEKAVPAEIVRMKPNLRVIKTAPRENGE